MSNKLCAFYLDKVQDSLLQSGNLVKLLLEN